MTRVLLFALCLLGAPFANAQITLPITFEEEIDYQIVDFGNASSQLAADPDDAENTVVETLRQDDAACFAGTTVASTTGFAEPLPFAPGATTMSIRVRAPAAGIPVRFKVEKVDDAGISVEAEVLTTVADTWETLVFDFADEVEGTAALNFNAEYTKGSVFFNFQCPDETPVPAATYYWDDVTFGVTNTAGEEEGGFPEALALTSVYPNPFLRSATVQFALPTTDRVEVSVYNVLGQRVAVLADGLMEAGTHALPFDAVGLAAGTYLVRLRSSDATATRSVVLTQ